MKKKILALLLAVGIAGTSVGASAAEFDAFTDGTAGTAVEFESPEQDMPLDESPEADPEEIPKPEQKETEEVPEVDGEESVEAASSGEYSIKIDKKVVQLGYDREAIDYDFNLDLHDYMEAQEFVNITNTGTKTVHLKYKTTMYDGKVRTGALTTLKPGETYCNEYYMDWGHYAGTYVNVMDITDESGQIHEQIKCITTVTGPRDMFDIKEKELKLKTKYDGAKAAEKKKIIITNTSKEAYTPIAFSESKDSAFVISKFSKKVLNPGETGYFTISGKKDYLPGYYKERLKICTSENKKDYKLMNAAIRFYPKVVKVEPIKSVTYQNAFPADRFFLPNVKLMTSDGKSKSAEVKWDIEHCGYNPKETKEQTFTVHGKAILPAKVGNPDKLSLDVQIQVTVSGYKKVKAPVLETAYAWGDFLSVRMLENAENSSAYRLLIGKTPDFREKKQYVYSFWKSSLNAYGSHSVYGHYIAPGHYYCAVKAVNQKNGKNVYSGWSNVLEFDIEPKKPETPVVKSVTVSGNNIKITTGNIAQNAKYRCILSKKSNADKFRDISDDKDIVSVTGNKWGKTKVVSMKGIPKGTYYLHVESWYEERVSNGVKTWYSDWSKPRKVIIR